MAVYLGTATPSGYYIGTSSVSAIYLGSTQVFTSSGGGAAWGSFSTAWTNVGFSGAGTSSSKYFKASIADSVFDGGYATVLSGGTVRVTATSLDCAGDFKIYKNGTAAYTLADNSGGDGVIAGSIPSTGTNSCSITVSANDVIRFGSSGDHTAFANLNIWWQ